MAQTHHFHSFEYTHHTDVCQIFQHHSVRKERRQEIRWWGCGAAVDQGEMKLQGPEFFLLCSRKCLPAQPAQLCLCTTWAWTFSRGGTEVERQEGTGKKDSPHPTIKVQGTHCYLTFCPLNDLYCYDLLAWWKELVAQSLLFFPTQRPHHFRNHSSIGNSFPLQEPKAKESTFLTAHLKCFWAYAPSIHTRIHRLYICLIIWKCGKIKNIRGGRGELRMRWKITRKRSLIFLPTP